MKKRTGKIVLVIITIATAAGVIGWYRKGGQVWAYLQTDSEN